MRKAIARSGYRDWIHDLCFPQATNSAGHSTR